MTVIEYVGVGTMILLGLACAFCLAAIMFLVAIGLFKEVMEQTDCFREWRRKRRYND